MIWCYPGEMKENVHMHEIGLVGDNIVRIISITSMCSVYTMSKNDFMDGL